MQFGLFCTAQAGTADQAPETGKGFQDYLDLNIEAEALGYCSSFLVEHHFSGWSQVSATLTLLTCLAMRTTTLRVGSSVMVLPWHNPVLLAELGPGRGTLIADLLRVARAVPEFRHAARLWLVEASPVLRREQCRRLAAAEPGIAPRFADSVDSLPDGPLLLVADGIEPGLLG